MKAIKRLAVKPRQVALIYNYSCIIVLACSHRVYDTMNTCILFGDLTLPTSIRLSSDTEARLNFLADHTGRSKAYYLREIIESGIDDMEDYYLAMDVLERVRKGQEKIHSSDNMRKSLGLDD